MGHLDAILHGHARNRHKGTHVRGAHAGMLAAVLGHVDELARLFDQAERRLAHRLWRPHKRDDRAVGALSGSTSSNRHPSTVSTTAATALMTSGRRPSLMLGTHSIKRCMGQSSATLAHPIGPYPSQISPLMNTLSTTASVKR